MQFCWESLLPPQLSQKTLWLHAFTVTRQQFVVFALGIRSKRLWLLQAMKTLVGLLREAFLFTVLLMLNSLSNFYNCSCETEARRGKQVSEIEVPVRWSNSRLQLLQIRLSSSEIAQVLKSELSKKEIWSALLPRVRVEQRKTQRKCTTRLK